MEESLEARVDVARDRRSAGGDPPRARPRGTRPRSASRTAGPAGAATARASSAAGVSRWSGRPPGTWPGRRRSRGAATPRRSCGATACSSPRRSRATSCPARRPSSTWRRARNSCTPTRSGADRRHTFKLLALDAKDGRVLWERTAWEGTPVDSRHKKASFASPTAVTDGERVYAYFGSEGLYAYDFDGKLAWKFDPGVVATMGVGVGTSPLLYRDLVILLCDEDNGEKSFLVALDRRTGKEAWRVPRKIEVSWATPVIVKAAGRDELVTAGNQLDPGLRPGDRPRAVADEGPREQRGHDAAGGRRGRGGVLGLPLEDHDRGEARRLGRRHGHARRSSGATTRGRPTCPRRSSTTATSTS